MSKETDPTAGTVGAIVGASVNVLVGHGAGTTRQLITATLVAVNSKTIYVRLPNGNVIRRKVARDVPGWRVGVNGDLAQPTRTTRTVDPQQRSRSTFEYRGFGDAA